MPRCRATAALLALLVAGWVAHGADRPNIVLLFVDDLGWSDLGYRNPAVVETPQIDALARESVDFLQCYIPTPTCSPSRAALLTGKHPARLQFFRHIEGTPPEPFNHWRNDPAQVPSRNWLPLEEVTYAEALGELGYHNVLVGKWHLGDEKFHPTRQGFHRQIGTTNQGHPHSFYPDYFRSSDVLQDARDEYLTDRLTDEAVNFIETHDPGRPFMLSFWYYAVHSPHIGRKDHVRHFQARGFSGAYAEYLGMIKAVDDSVGRIRAALQRRGIAENTIIILLSDQGGAFENRPLRGGKMRDTLYEGGARVPFLFHWPGVAPAGPNRSIVHSPDLFPTLLEIAGGDPASHPGVDGVSLLPVIRSGGVLERGRPIFGYRAYEDLYASVREGDWKLLGFRSGKLELYNLAEDEGETTDLSARHPGHVARLKAMLVGWEREMNLTAYSGYPNHE